MLELVYKSKATPSVNGEEIEKILSTARNFNAKHNLTGCLIFHRGYFIQLLEGEPTTLKNLYTKIETDPRHTDIELLYEKNKENRNFDNWGMAFVNLDEADEFNLKLFEDNLSTYADLTPKITKASDIFWSEVKQILK